MGCSARLDQGKPRNERAGKAILLLEHAVDLKWHAWNVYRQLTGDSNIAKTYQALLEYTNEGK